MTLVAVLLLTSPVYAGGKYEIRERTPEVENALHGRKARYNEIQSLKASGALGEDNRAYVKAFSPSAEAIASAENADRRILYHAISEQNGLGTSGSEGLTQVHNTFAEVQREKARSGDSIQLPNGEWVKK